MYYYKLQFISVATLNVKAVHQVHSACMMVSGNYMQNPRSIEFGVYTYTIVQYNISTAYRDCKHAREQGHWRNGVYMVQPDYDLPAFKVYCDMTTDGGGWTVIQRRQDGSENFYRSWNDYVRGFGNLQGEFFLGLYNIHLLTEISGTQLRVDLEDFNSGRAYAMYNEFSVDDSESEYTLEVSGYSGTAGDSLSSHNEMKFSTYDQDNDMAFDVHCAQEYKGGWWYNHCFSSNLNGAYLSQNNSSTSDCQSVVWYHWKHSCTPLRRTVMMIRSE